MLEINPDYDSNETVVDRRDITKAANAGIVAIKKELPEGIHTVEVVKRVISEMEQIVNSSKVLL